MSPLVWTLLGWGLLAAPDPDKPAPLRYLRLEGDRFVLESEVLTTKGGTYTSKTTRRDETLTLTIRHGEKGEPLMADALLEKGKQSKKAVLDLTGPTAQLKRGGTLDLFKAPANPVVTSAPDWSDVFTLVRRYDAAKGGKQEFAGLWFHPALPHRILTFTIERTGTDKVMVKDKPVELTRYQAHLRSGDYIVWALPDSVVCKLMGREAKAVPVVLEGYEEATRNLTPPARKKD
jgi:hypothetical protein